MPIAPSIQQPQQGARLGGSSICQGLVFATTGSPGTGFIDFVSGCLPTITGATSGVDSAGIFAKPAASSGQIYWPAGSTGLDKVTGPGTLLVCMRSNNNTRNWRAFGSCEDSSTGDGVYLLYDDGNNAANGFNAGANNNNYRLSSNSGALGTNSEQSFHTFGFSWDGATVWMWADGKQDKSAAAAFTPNANTGRFTRLQSDATASDFLFAYAWNRVLSAAEIASITRNPWQIFVSQRAAVAAPGGAGTATPSGVSATSSIGTVTATGAASAAPSGVSATASLGTVSATGGASATAVPSGVAATASVGTAIATGAANAQAAGVSASANIGTVFASGGGAANANPGGVSAAASLGIAVASGGAVTAPSGVSAVSGIGSVSATGAATASLVGVSANAGLGVVVASGGGAIPVAAIDYDRWLLAEAESRLLRATVEVRTLVVEKENRLLIAEAA